MAAAIVYLLCAFTSTLCALALGFRYFKTGTRLLMFCAIGFAGLAISNVMLVIDLLLLPQLDLSVLRGVPALLGLATMLWGLVEEAA